MLGRDFFAYCTTLKLLELKAIGELSRVRHLEEGETIYSTGDPGDSLFIINRGVVEVIQPSAANAPATYLSRGDVLGDVETLSGLPRKQIARTCEPVSVQCFQQKDFPELIRRVPSFFHFLSGQLASRLSQARDLAMTQSHCLELGGNLSNFDLITVYQTISNSAQTGQLRISNPLTGTFTFSTTELPQKDWIQSERITKNASEMLINALQGRDEFAELKQKFADGAAMLERNKASLTWPAGAPPESLSVAEQVWDFAGKGPATVEQIFRHCAVCELKIYQVVDELIQSRHFVWSHEATAVKVA